MKNLAAAVEVLRRLNAGEKPPAQKPTRIEHAPGVVEENGVLNITAAAAKDHQLWKRWTDHAKKEGLPVNYQTPAPAAPSGASDPGGRCEVASLRRR